MTASTTVPAPGTPATVPPDRARRWPAFDVCGALPQGTTVLEASAAGEVVADVDLLDTWVRLGKVTAAAR